MRLRLVLFAMLTMVVSTSSAHDWFGGLKSPTGQQCCTNQDCLPADHRYNPQSHRLEIRAGSANSDRGIGGVSA